MLAHDPVQRKTDGGLGPSVHGVRNRDDLVGKVRAAERAGQVLLSKLQCRHIDDWPPVKTASGDALLILLAELYTIHQLRQAPPERIEISGIREQAVRRGRP